MYMTMVPFVPFVLYKVPIKYLGTENRSLKVKSLSRSLKIIRTPETTVQVSSIVLSGT